MRSYLKIILHNVEIGKLKYVQNITFFKDLHHRSH